MDKLSQRAKEIISKNRFMTIATADSDGKPWISPVFFAYDDNYNLFWVSDKDSRHSKLIRENSQVAIVIFDSSKYDGDYAVYFEAEAVELSEPAETKHAMEIYNARPQKEDFQIKSVSEVTGDAVWRIYKAVPKKVSVLTDGENVDWQYIDKRVEIKLKQATE